MKKSSSRTPKATTGTCTADLGERGKFVGDEKEMKLYKDPGEIRWYLMATDNVKEDELRFYDLVVSVPDEGNVTDKDYEIDDDFDNPCTAKATFLERNGPGGKIFVADTGQLTFTIDEKTEKATATFKFEAKFKDEVVTVTKGTFDLEGFDPSLTGPMGLKASGNFTAAIQDGEITKNYSANEFALTNQPGNDTNFPAPHWWAWSKQPGSPNVVIALFIADTLEINKKYTLTRDVLKFGRCTSILIPPGYGVISPSTGHSSSILFHQKVHPRVF